MGNAALAAQLSSIMGDEALYDELSRRGYFKGRAEEVKAFLEPIMEKVKQGTELTAEEAEARDLFLSEAPALLAEKILGDGHFIRRLVTEQGSVAEKILVKLTELKESLSRMTSKDAKSLHRAVVKAEGLYLKAVEEAGMRFDGEKFVGSEDEEEEQTSVKESKKEAEYGDYEKPITLQDIETLRSIGRKSVNAFTSEDIEKAQKWAYKFYQEMGTKSPFFRAWFGDWRAYERSNFVDVLEMELMEGKNPRGAYKSKDTGWIINSSSVGYDETVSHSGKDKKSLIAMRNIDKIIENAVLLDTEVSEYGRGKKSVYTAFMHKLYAPIRIDGKMYLAKLSVEESNAPGQSQIDKKFYHVRAIEIETASSVGIGQSHTPIIEDTASTVSIAQLFDTVKTYDKEFSPKPVNELMLDENKEPRVFYHGTRSQFTEFILQDKPTFGRALGDGFYFTPSYSKAHQFANGLFSKGQDRGGIVMPVYIRMENPYVIQEDADRTKWRNEYHKGNYDGIIDLKNQTWYVEGSTQIKSATDNIGTFDGRNPDIRYSRKPKSQTSVDLENPPTELTGAQRQIVAEHSRPKVYTKAEAVTVIDDIVKILEAVYNEEGGIGEASGFAALKKKTTEAATATLWKSFNKDMTGKEREAFANKLAEAIMTVERTGKSANNALGQSLLPKTDIHTSKPADPRRNALILSDAPLSQSRLFKACVCAFYPSPALPKPSWPQTPRQASISCPQRPCALSSKSSLAKGNRAPNSLKLRYMTPLLATPDLTKTCKPCFADSILPEKSEHRHSQ